MSDTFDLSKYGGSSGADNTDVPTFDLSKYSTPAPTATDTPSASVPTFDLSKYGGAGSSGDSSSPWKGIFNNPIGNEIVNLPGQVLGAFGHGMDALRTVTGLDHLRGAAEGALNPTLDAPSQSDGSYLGEYKSLGEDALNAIKNIGQSAWQGFLHPDQTNQNFNAKSQELTQNFDPVSRVVMNTAAGAAVDPLSFVPIGPLAKVAGGALKGASDAVGATPYIAKAVDAVANAPIIKPALQGAQDTYGKMFTKNYGASPDLVSTLNNATGSKALDQQSILNSLSDLSQGHGLNSDQLNEIGHVIEKTLTGTPEQQALAQKLSDLGHNGPQMPQGTSPIGTNALLHTASAVNGDPLLQGTLPDYFKHMYDSVPEDLKGVFPKQDLNGSGLSATGAFNLPRTYPTLQDAQAAGLKPVLNPFQVLGEHLNQSSKALRNNEVIQQVKNTPGLLFPKDPIDEVAKLVKTGRMTTDQAAQQLGMTVDDLKKGFVQSKVPQLSGAYIRPADEAALMDHLNPAKPSGPFAFFDKLNNLFNKGYLLSPLPHGHNIYTNGALLGGAKPSDIKAFYDDIKNGVDNPMQQRAVQAGAINNPVGGSFSKAVARAVAPKDGNVLSRTVDATKGAAANILTGNGKIGGNLLAPLQPLRDAGHNLLWNNDAAIRTTLFKNAVDSGATDAEAAAHANKFMVDYNNLTPFERQYVKPLINFYSWKKGNIPLQISQTLSQTPKYMAYQNAKNAASQIISGNPTDDKGRIDSGNQLPDGSHTVIDPYSPMDELNKIGDKGLIQFIYNSLNPGVKEAITQGTSISQAAGAPIQNKFPLYNPAAPTGYNIRSGLAHIINNMNPLNSSAVLGQAGSQSNLINHAFGMPTNNKPDQGLIDLITKLMGGFTANANPATDAKTQYYQVKDNAANLRKYQKAQAKAK